MSERTRAEVEYRFDDALLWTVTPTRATAWRLGTDEVENHRVWRVSA